MFRHVRFHFGEPNSGKQKRRTANRRVFSRVRKRAALFRHSTEPERTVFGVGAGVRHRRGDKADGRKPVFGEGVYGRPLGGGGKPGRAKEALESGHAGGAEQRLAADRPRSAHKGGPVGVADARRTSARRGLHSGWRTGRTDQTNFGSRGTAAETSRPVRRAGRRAAERRVALRPARHRKDVGGPRRRTPHRVCVHPRLWRRTRPEVHRRGHEVGARTLHNGTHTRAFHHLYGRNRFYWRRALRQPRRRVGGAKNHARATQPAGRLRSHCTSQSHHGHEQTGHPRRRSPPAGKNRPQNRVPFARPGRSQKHLPDPLQENGAQRRRRLRRTRRRDRRGFRR